MDWIRGSTEFFLRWLHVAAGIIWIGHLYFFNFVNAHVAKTYDADSKKKVVPELMPRALYWFRWGAMYTWVTGVLLLSYVYYMANNMVPLESTVSNGTASWLALGILVVIFFVYDILWKTVKNEKVGVIISAILVVALLYGLSCVFIGRALYAHLGAYFGTIMFLNVWMRIWPSQKKIIAGIKGTAPAPDASVPALAALRSKHNTYMSVPLVFFMISNHYPVMYGSDQDWIIASIMVLTGWIAVKLLYAKSAASAPLSIGDQAS